MHLGYPGLAMLLSYTKDELNPAGQWILRFLLEEPIIQSCIIVPSLMNNFHEADIKMRCGSLAALSRLFSRTKSALVKDVYLYLLKESALDKSLIIGAIRALGDPGEIELYSIMKTVKNSKVRSLISFYLGFRIPWCQDTCLNFRFANNYSELNQFTSGALCHYIGDLSSPDFSRSLEEWTDHEKGELVVSQRDFVIVLNRWLKIKENQYLQDPKSLFNDQNSSFLKSEWPKSEFPLTFDYFID